MHQRDYRFYIDKAKEKQGFKYDNQIDMALGFKGSMTTLICQGKRHLSDEKMIELAKLGGLSDIIALMDNHLLKAETEAEKTAYTKILQKITACLIGACGLTALTAAPALASAGIAAASGGLQQCMLISALLYIMEINRVGKEWGGYGRLQG